MFSRQFVKIARPFVAKKFSGAMSLKAACASTSSRVTIAQAKNMPKNYDEMPNDVLLSMAIMGDQEAREERLIREIMAVDDVSW